ncbi:MAG: hypothetical protein ACOYEP_08210 [Limnochordia bacterium]|jgi:hypothetical protein
MARFSISWNPLGIKKLGFRGFRWFPISPRRQLIAGLLCTLVAIVGSLGASLLPIPNLNLVVFVLIGYFGAARIHPHPLIGPAFVSICVIGLSWSMFMLFPDPIYDMPALLLVSLTSNLLVSMTVGAILATILPIKA